MRVGLACSCILMAWLSSILKNVTHKYITESQCRRSHKLPDPVVEVEQHFLVSEAGRRDYAPYAP